MTGINDPEILHINIEGSVDFRCSGVSVGGDLKVQKYKGQYSDNQYSYISTHNHMPAARELHKDSMTAIGSSWIIWDV
jgi:hypothetical protein